jgi:hypothetical protein
MSIMLPEAALPARGWKGERPRKREDLQPEPAAVLDRPIRQYDRYLRIERRRDSKSLGRGASVVTDASEKGDTQRNFVAWRACRAIKARSIECLPLL